MHGVEALELTDSISFDTAVEEDLCRAACTDEALLKTIVEETAGESRSRRQKAAAVIALVAHQRPEVLVPHAAAIADGLHRPEAKTRWELLSALVGIVSVDARACEKALPGAEACLYDEASATTRAAAFRFIARYGATTEIRSEKVWPLLDEAIQCYHGDPEFDDMLTETCNFASGTVSAKVRSQLADRMAFDATNSRGLVGRRARQIVAACS